VETRPTADLSVTLSKSQRDALIPAQVLDALKQGNLRFRSRARKPRDYVAQQLATAAGQYPAAVVLGCIDSRVPAEIIFDVGIGDTFNIRMAGSVVDGDAVGALEFSCAVAGAKLVVLLGHTSCGAVEGAIDNVELGSLTSLLARLKPAISETAFSGERSSKNAAFVEAVARTNVKLGIEKIRLLSPILADLEKEGSIQIVGAMYDLTTGNVEFVSQATA
jgi:carbonic anhydrase